MFALADAQTAANRDHIMGSASQHRIGDIGLHIAAININIGLLRHRKRSCFHEIKTYIMSRKICSTLKILCNSFVSFQQQTDNKGNNTKRTDKLDSPGICT